LRAKPQSCEGREEGGGGVQDSGHREGTTCVFFLAENFFPRGQELRLDRVIAILSPSELACGKLMARVDGYLEQ
jgi:hypothetical protein